MTEVIRTLEAVEASLHSIEPLTERVDARAAEFARRYRARIHYLSAVGSSRARQIQEVFRIISERFGGTRLTLADGDLGLPLLRLGEAGILCGESLRRPPAERTLSDIDAIEDDVSCFPDRGKRTVRVRLLQARSRGVRHRSKPVDRSRC